MLLIAGLGNPGEQYTNSRHNVGFRVLDFIASQFQDPNLKFENNSKFYSHILKLPKAILAKPQTFMNSSGLAVSSLLNFYSLTPDNLYVVHDDLDLSLGEYKIQKGKGPKVHGGVNSIEGKIGTGDFWRVRLGVDNRDPKDRIPGENYVLQNFSPEEEEKIDNVIRQVCTELSSLYG